MPSPHKRIRHSNVTTFTFKEHCIYCGECCFVEKDKKNPHRWVPDYLVKEVEERKWMKSEDRILKQCNIRADKWAEEVNLRVIGAPADLHASNARYHKDCLTRFFSFRCAPGESKS